MEQKEIRFVISSQINDDIKKLRYQVFIVEQGFRVEDEFDDDTRQYFHLEGYMNNELMCYVRYYYVDKDVVHLGRIIVKKEYRNKGFGKQMLVFLENKLAKAKYSVLELSAQLQVKDFYLKLGYKPVGDIYIEPEIQGVPHIKMVKRILKI